MGNCFGYATNSQSHTGLSVLQHNCNLKGGENNSRPLFCIIWSPCKAVSKNSGYGAGGETFHSKDVQGTPRKFALWLGFHEIFAEANSYQPDRLRQLLVF